MTAKAKAKRPPRPKRIHNVPLTFNVLGDAVPSRIGRAVEDAVAKAARFASGADVFDWRDVRPLDVPLGLDLKGELLEILRDHCGESGTSEGAVETLRRIIAERDSFALKLARRMA